jgi:KaiC/GvpD/RAD55 family RecA-like ATPase
MRYVEIDGQLRKVMVVIKMRGGNHSKDIREYVITDKGVVVIHPRRTDYDGLTTGIPSEPARARRRRTKPLRNRRLHEKMVAMNEALILGSVRQHELTEAGGKIE